MKRHVQLRTVDNIAVDVLIEYYQSVVKEGGEIVYRNDELRAEGKALHRYRVHAFDIYVPEVGSTKAIHLTLTGDSVHWLQQEVSSIHSEEVDDYLDV